MLESLRALNALDVVRPIRSNVQFSFRVLYSHSTIDEDFDGDDEDSSLECLEVCYLLAPTIFVKSLSPKSRLGMCSAELFSSFLNGHLRL